MIGSCAVLGFYLLLLALVVQGVFWLPGGVFHF